MLRRRDGTYAPDCGKGSDQIQATMGHPCQTSPYCKVNDVEIRQDTPHAVNLGVVPVDLRDDQENEAEKDRGSEPGDERVGVLVELYQAIGAVDILEHLVG